MKEGWGVERMWTYVWHEGYYVNDKINGLAKWVSENEVAYFWRCKDGEYEWMLNEGEEKAFMSEYEVNMKWHHDEESKL